MSVVEANADHDPDRTSITRLVPALGRALEAAGGQHGTLS